jgi:hypothetical protein
MKKLTLLLLSVAGASALVACNGGGNSGGGGDDKPAATITITPNNVDTGIGAKTPIMVNVVANVTGVESFTMSLLPLTNESNLNGVESLLECSNVNLATARNNCNTNFLLKPVKTGQYNYTLSYQYTYNNKVVTGSTNFAYNSKPGQIVDGVAINTNYVYGTTTLTFLNTNSTSKTITSLVPTSGYTIINDRCTESLLAVNAACSVTITPTITSAPQKAALQQQLYDANVGEYTNSLTIKYSDNTSATFNIDIKAVGYPLSNINTSNGIIRVRYQWQNPSTIGSAGNNRDLDIKTGFIGNGAFEQVANEYLGYGFNYNNIGYYGMMSGNDAQAALDSNNTFMAWAGDTIAGSDDVGLATEAILINFAKLNAFGSTNTIQVPLAAHWFSRSGTDDDNFNIIIDVYPSNTLFEATSINGDYQFITDTTPLISYTMPAYTTIVNSTGGTNGLFENFGAINCNLTTSTCYFQ